MFQPTSPLHDGAVVIKDGRIRAVSCVLPLSTVETLDKDFGTRHRAAIGITEVADAVSVVVSEETGQVSFCAGGAITRNAAPEALKKALKTLLLGGESASGG